MSQTSATKLISKLRYNIRDRRRLSTPEGPQGRHNKIKKTITALLKYERIELNFHRADESRGYAERLISEAIRYGDSHKPTMDIASYWIIEPQIVHKLFKVLAPRYKTSTQSYTKMWRAPNIYPGHKLPKCVLELRNNIYPSLEADKSYNKNLIHNVLLEGARKMFQENKAKAAATAEAKAAVTEQKEVSGVEASQSEVRENVETEVPEAAATSVTEQKEVSGVEASQSEVRENVETEVPVGGDAESDKVRMTIGESGLSSEENLKTSGKDESELRTDVDSSLKGDLDLSKMKITDDKPKETFSESEKK